MAIRVKTQRSRGMESRIEDSGEEGDADVVEPIVLR